MLGILLPGGVIENHIDGELHELEELGVEFCVMQLGDGAAAADWLGGITKHTRLSGARLVAAAAARCTDLFDRNRAGNGDGRSTGAIALADLLGVLRRCRQRGVTHLHAHYADAPAEVARRAAAELGITFSFTAHSKGIYAKDTQGLAARIRAAAFVVGCSESIADRLVEVAPDRADRVHCVRHGLLPLAHATKLASYPGETIQLLAAGRLTSRKAYDVAIDALAGLVDSGFRAQLTIIGGGDPTALIEQAETLGVSEHLTIFAPLPRDEFLDRLALADCFVATSRVLSGGNRDGVPNALVEAMAMRVPVVAARAGGQAEVVQEGRTGLLFGSEDADGLARAVRQCADQRELAAGRAQAAAQLVAEQFDAGRNARALAQLLEAPAKAVTTVVRRRLPLRVGYVAKRYPRLSETFILQEVLEHERQGTRLHIFALKKPDEGRFHQDLARVRADVSYVPTPLGSSFKRMAGMNWRRFLRDPQRYLATLRLARSCVDRSPMRAFLRASMMAKEVEERQLEHLHAHFGTGATQMAMLVSSLTGVPYSFTAHARDIFGDHIHQPTLALKIRRAATTVLVSDYTHDHVRTQVESSGRLRRVYNGVRPDLLDGPIAPFIGVRPLILGVGRLVPKKGFEYLIDAAALLRERGCSFRLAIVGTGPELRRLRKRARQRGVSVAFLGAQPHDRVLDAMRLSRVVALPAVVDEDGDRDVLPTVLLEAQALGRPVVSTFVSGIPEMIVDGSTGYVIDERDAEALADRLAKLIGETAPAERMGREARAFVRSRFSVANAIQELRAEFARAAGRSQQSVAGRAWGTETPGEPQRTTADGIADELVPVHGWAGSVSESVPVESERVV